MPDRAQNEDVIRAQIFACTNKTERECFELHLFGTDRVYGAATMRVRQGDFLFLLNLDSDVLYGVFRAVSNGKMNMEQNAWSGRYPYQVRIESINKITPLKNAKKLLKELGITRLTQIGKDTTVILLELFRPESLPKELWLHNLIEARDSGALAMEIGEPRNWSLPTELMTGKKNEEEIPMLEATTLWDFPKQSYGKSPKGNNKYAGVTPAQIVWNLVWRYTEPGDVVVDPMAGSGTTLDVCKEEGRNCICYDIVSTRPEIIQNDSRTIPLPENHVHMVFVDSPYGDNIKYNDHPQCIGKISSETEVFYDELEKVMRECHRILKPGKVLGWLIGDQWVKNEFTPVGFKVYQRLSKYFDTVDIICVARRGQSSHTGLWYNRARKFNFFLRGFKYLFIMRKPSEDEHVEKEKRNVKWAYYDRSKSKANSS
jgi:DNA modification methylase